MNKHIFSLALVASLTACGGGGSSSSSNDDTTDPVDPAPQPETSYCEAVDNTITLAEGASCQLSPEQLDKISISVGTDEVSCSNGRISLGGINSGTLSGNGLLIQCEAQEAAVDRSAYRVTNSTEFAKVNELSDDFVNFDSMTVEGNAEAITEDGVSYAQVHSNLEDGDFSFTIDTRDMFFVNEGSAAKLRIAFSSAEVSAESAINGTSNIKTQLTVNNLHTFGSKLTLNCNYGGSLTDISCENLDIKMDNPPAELPARLNIHVFGCTEEAGCRTGITVPVQFN
ncbi:hypothetical protein GCM10011297_21480 [Bacterioplanes sanyensis]|uniref:hypothetical protein n=1 Tax=Bacterioplanes sanyensis TaxID=1249553 RepID=UPI001674B342|nr:hypothetical protein [Bacterioplanes sanyensis]GGY48256.1 hypothetical protein GCM10011297_21480 [Bacterioplanes sanyensis]